MIVKNHQFNSGVKMTQDIQCKIEKVTKTIAGIGKYRIDIWGWTLSGTGQVPQVSIAAFDHFNYQVDYHIREDVCSASKLQKPIRCGFHIELISKDNCRNITLELKDPLAGEVKSVLVQLEDSSRNDLSFYLKKTAYLVKHEGVFSMLKKGSAKIRQRFMEEALYQQTEEDYLSRPLQVALRDPERVRPAFVPKLKNAPLQAKPVRLIAFYTSWGLSESDWANLAAARSQFAGHLQPRQPGDLGCYDPGDPLTFKHQIELARLYGLEGFCFDFSGRKSPGELEEPLKTFIANPDLYFPFCLCWHSEKAAEQPYSEQDYRMHCESIVSSMKDPRYIHINGRPLLLLAGFDLKPAVDEAIRLLKEKSLAAGLGQIYLVSLSEAKKAWSDRGMFDAAVESVPYRLAEAEVSDQVELPDQGGPNIYDWRVFVKNSRNYAVPAYKTFRTLCPSWDDTPRLKDNSTIFILSSPAAYQEWLCNVIEDTMERFSHPEERLVFLNAWNRWSEGAYLEPDRQQGYAYLEATRMALVRCSKVEQHKLSAQRRTLAVVIHAFYEDVLQELLDHLQEIKFLPLMLYVSTIPEKRAIIENKLAESGLLYQFFTFENRGRDILPFLKILPRVMEDGHRYLIKVHTKKSLHRVDGEDLRHDIIDKLLSADQVSRHYDYLETNPRVGILGPRDHVVPMSYYYEKNAARIEELAPRLGITKERVHRLSFVAGSMFMARTEALVPLLNLALDDDHFELEAGQVDGTLAHALERLFAVSALAKKMITTCINET